MELDSTLPSVKRRPSSSPGFPLDQEDHLRLARVTLARGFGARRVGLYVEQPYAAVRGEPPDVLPAVASLVARREPEWQALNTRVAARWRKVRAWRAYRSQYQHYGYTSLVNVLRYEARYGGEMTTLQ